ncbi:2OG-Fe(II) oxygenase [Sphingomonas sp. AX6]|uniref:2OG-Fe(II) oxygenase n=1 Tax=Sphingomonas sp. AX6 TaxID=2653171 RepID=UPI00135757CD|nr:2OG-Fe(II) oxygenase family protein [Sphingomonas sp. AX6]
MKRTDFALNPSLDANALARRYAENGRVRIADFLCADVVTRLACNLRERTDWHWVMNSGDKVFEVTRDARAALSGDQLRALDDATYATARSGFQYRFETLRVPDDDAERATSDDMLAAFAAWLSSPEPLALLRRITGADAIDFADMQATAYGPGDFLTAHDDAVAGKRRHAAYVLGLNSTWRTEWGGLLLFHEPDDSIQGRVPAFNTLDLFSVPQLHSVSEVTRAAANRRYSITGWLRSR